FSDDVKEEMDNLEELGIDKMILWDINKPVRAELIKDPLETFAKKIMKNLCIDFQRHYLLPLIFPFLVGCLIEL
ncbi:unnamed protein product, partial [marine sediment metagenome]